MMKTATEDPVAASIHPAFLELQSLLDAQNLKYEQVDDELVYQVRYPAKFMPLTCFAQIDPDWEQFAFYVLIPIRVREDLRLVIAEYLTRVNYGLRVGNFEMDFEDGELRYKSVISFKDERLTQNWIRNAVLPAISTVDRYAPGFAKIIRGGKTAAEAFAEVESGGALRDAKPEIDKSCLKETHP